MWTVCGRVAVRTVWIVYDTVQQSELCGLSVVQCSSQSELCGLSVVVTQSGLCGLSVIQFSSQSELCGLWYSAAVRRNLWTVVVKQSELCGL